MGGWVGTAEPPPPPEVRHASDLAQPKAGLENLFKPAHNLQVGEVNPPTHTKSIQNRSKTLLGPRKSPRGSQSKSMNVAPSIKPGPRPLIQG